MIALSALPLLACLASAQSPGDAVRGRPTQLAESGFRDADGNLLLLLSEENPDSRLRGPLWLHGKTLQRLARYPGGAEPHPAPGKAALDFYEPRLDGELGTLAIDGPSAKTVCGKKTAALTALTPDQAQAAADMLDPELVTMPHIERPRRLLETQDGERAFLLVDDLDHPFASQHSLFVLERGDSDRWTIKETPVHHIHERQGDKVYELEDGANLVDRFGSEPATWQDAMGTTPLKPSPATWKELERRGVSKAQLTGVTFTPCDSALKP
jgi:hypothetical protein